MSARLTVDVGNSSVGVATWRDDQAELRRFADPAEAAAHVTGPGRLIAVNRARLAVFLDALAPPRRAEIQLLRGVPVRLADPVLGSSAGMDRLAAAVALQPGPAIAVDGGTAVTVDLVDAAGVYRGGFIAPGPRAGLSGLAVAAPALPALEGLAVPIEPGLDTPGALSAGAWGLVVGGVDRLVTAALAALGGQAQVIATGGWGAQWAAASSHAGVRVDALLVHRGIRAWGVTGC